MIANRHSILLLAAAGLGLAACNQQETSKTEVGNHSVTVPPPAKPDLDAASSRFLAAAEPFEALTEQAATAKPEQLKAMINDIQKAADGISPALSPASRAVLSGYLAKIDRAAKADLRTDVALSAVEGYRTLVESASDTGKVPKAVSLLDYAGFRYQANLAAEPIDWKDVDASLAFAKSKWSSLSPKVTDAALAQEFSAALSKLESAAQARDVAAAKKAATSELDLVDKLENYFGTHG